MSCLTNHLKAVEAHIGNDNITNMLEINLKAYYDWALLNDLGGWTEVNIPTSGAFGGDFSKLRLVSDPNYTDGQVWEGARKDWVYETGVLYSDITGGVRSPMVVGTPTVNNVNYTGSYYINYPDGRVIFDTPISTSSVVKIPHSYRTVQIYRAEDAQWWRELQYRSFRVDSNQFSYSESGNWSIMGVNRVQLPAVVVEAVPRGSSRGFELGADTLVVHRELEFGILAENRWERNNLMDIISNQTDRYVQLFNTNTLAASGAFPLDYRGMLVGSLMYPDWISPTRFRYASCRMINSSIVDIKQVHPNLYLATVKTTMEVII